MAGETSPPVAAMRSRLPWNDGAKTIVPSRPHVPPRGSPDASARICGVPAESSVRLELASGEKAQGSGVRGPERLTRSFRSGQSACDEGIEGTDPEGGVPIRVSGRESQPVPIRRHGHGIGKRGVRRGDHLQANGAGAARSGTTEVGERQGEAGQQEKTRGSPGDSLRERSPFLGSNGPPPAPDPASWIQPSSLARSCADCQRSSGSLARQIADDSIKAPRATWVESRRSEPARSS